MKKRLRVARFQGDPNGYCFDPASVVWVGSTPIGWTDAQIGVSGDGVIINLSKAYIIEDFR